MDHSSNDGSVTGPVHIPENYAHHPMNSKYLDSDMKSELFTIIARKEAFKILQTSSLKTIRKYLEQS